MCGTGEWISVIAKCDTVIDCLDASDETGCNLKTVGRMFVLNVLSEDAVNYFSSPILTDKHLTNTSV